MKQSSIAEIILRIRTLSKELQAASLSGHIASEQGYTDGKPNIRKTSVRIRELQAALHKVQMRRLKSKEERAA